MKAPSACAAPVQSPLPPLLHPFDAAAGAARLQHRSQAKQMSQSWDTDTGPVTLPGKGFTIDSGAFSIGNQGGGLG